MYWQWTGGNFFFFCLFFFFLFIHLLCCSVVSGFWLVRLLSLRTLTFFFRLFLYKYAVNNFFFLSSFFFFFFVYPSIVIMDLQMRKWEKKWLNDWSAVLQPDYILVQCSGPAIGWNWNTCFFGAGSVVQHYWRVLGGFSDGARILISSCGSCTLHCACLKINRESEFSVRGIADRYLAMTFLAQQNFPVTGHTYTRRFTRLTST